MSKFKIIILSLFFVVLCVLSVCVCVVCVCVVSLVVGRPENQKELQFQF